ncbi:hypothetical protein [Ottowia sp.]|uniref:hypothetical protein n=1 Tax=Ottowia sp. TaxID=1898956 RepID=UPI0025D2D28E|nr:hypothetical protein [Ottowia sp.]MBK6616384.1 hypothetical protein [Ottowia sp.]
MTMTANGLAKLQEEIGELLQETGKKLAYFTTDEHPDGAGPLSGRLVREMADVRAAMIFVSTQFGIRGEDIEAERDSKLALYRACPDIRMTAGGLAKLHEKMGHLLMISACLLSNFDVQGRRVTSGAAARLLPPVAALHAAMDYVIERFDLDGDAMSERCAAKVALFERWHADSTNGRECFHASVGEDRALAG